MTKSINSPTLDSENTDKIAEETMKLNYAQILRIAQKLNASKYILKNAKY